MFVTINVVSPQGVTAMLAYICQIKAAANESRGGETLDHRSSKSDSVTAVICNSKTFEQDTKNLRIASWRPLPGRRKQASVLLELFFRALIAQNRNCAIAT